MRQAKRHSLQKAGNRNVYRLALPGFLADIGIDNASWTEKFVGCGVGCVWVRLCSGTYGNDMTFFDVLH